MRLRRIQNETKWFDETPKCFKCILLLLDLLCCVCFFCVATRVIIVVVMHVDFYKIQCGYFTCLNLILNWFCVNLCVELVENEFMCVSNSIGSNENDDVDWSRMVKRTSMRCGDACVFFALSPFFNSIAILLLVSHTNITLLVVEFYYCCWFCSFKFVRPFHTRTHEIKKNSKI